MAVNNMKVNLVIGNRGSGKTHTGAEYVRKQVEAGCRSIALVASNYLALTSIMVEGESGIVSVFPSHQKPVVNKSKREITFHNGAKAYGYTSNEPKQIRGREFDAAWCDEIVDWSNDIECWNNLQHSMRNAGDKNITCTTSPRSTPLMGGLVIAAD